MSPNTADFTEQAEILSRLIESQTPFSECAPKFNSFLTSFPYCFGFWKKYIDLALAESFATASTLLTEMQQHIYGCVDAWKIVYNFPMELSDREDVVDNSFKDLNKNQATKAYVMKAYMNVLLQHIRYCWNTSDIWIQHIGILKETSPPAEVLAAYKESLSTPSAHTQRLLEECRAWVQHVPKEQLAGGTTTMKEVEGIARVTLARVEELEPIEKVLDKRRFFHPHPLDPTILKAWRQRLDIADRRARADPASFPASCSAYEACLVVCSPMIEFWVRYVTLVLEQATDPATAVEPLLARVLVHCPGPRGRLYAWGVREELQVTMDPASTAHAEELEALLRDHPTYVPALLAAVRRGLRQPREVLQALPAGSPLVPHLSAELVRSLEPQDACTLAEEHIDAAGPRAGPLVFAWLDAAERAAAAGDGSRLVTAYRKLGAVMDADASPLAEVVLLATCRRRMSWLRRLPPTPASLRDVRCFECWMYRRFPGVFTAGDVGCARSGPATKRRAHK